jgi:hypothetical protein
MKVSLPEWILSFVRENCQKTRAFEEDPLVDREVPTACFEFLQGFVVAGSLELSEETRE